MADPVLEARVNSLESLIGERKVEIQRERDRIDALTAVVTTERIEVTRISTTIKIWTAGAAIAIPLLTSFGVWLVLSRFKEAMAATTAPAAVIAPISPGRMSTPNLATINRP